MRFGIDVINFGAYGEPAVFQRVARAAEAAGWEAMFCWDHLAAVWDAPPPTGDPWVLLSAAACVTERLRLGTNVTPVPRRRAHVLATQVATLDRLSGGRVTLGVGLGGVADEFERFGEDATTKVRAGKLDESLEVMAGLWSGEVVRLDGRHVRAMEVQNPLVPVQRPRVPVWVGGDSTGALRRAARWDGWTAGLIVDETGQVVIPPEAIAAKVATIDKHRAAAAIVPAAASDEISPRFDVAVGAYSEPTPAGARMAAEYADAGATWWLEELNGFRGTLDDMLARVEAGPPR